VYRIPEIISIGWTPFYINDLVCHLFIDWTKLHSGKLLPINSRSSD